MRPLPRALTLVAVTALAAGGLSACLWDTESFDDQSRHGEKVTAVRMDLESGSVTLRGSRANSEVSVRRSVEYRGSKPKDATHRIDDGVLVLGGCGNDCSVDYSVDLPEGLPVSGETSNGSFSFTRVGEVRASSGSGSIDLNRVAGSTRVKTSNGSIKGRELAGKGINVQSSNGSIDIVSTRKQNIDASTSNGNVAVTVPEGRYAVTAKTSRGDTDVDVTDDPDAGNWIHASSSNGNIKVRASS
ncbi:DUF4097 family beta strand repeat-containing protein [Streptomyces sp. XM4193]|uniref:DUF4097 family beta strand repeat-containing protein n=1 Tax=Streptomyces sp. XM4193 TaxID=2929782 RepID=UPI001FFBFD22|nr:DUF4097 family beta strand repeat-containing protein [Streptomyces sp. XM4193]MCK1799120.1 DUF4097 family beta strand repeat-containing protein [Streptomyces sp. XM4193]